MSRTPEHVAIIMDGNGRWAKERNLPRSEGHAVGAKGLRGVVEECVQAGVRYLTVFGFSTENWQRSESEVGGLMKLFRKYLDSELPALLENGIRLRAVGDLERLPFSVRAALRRDIERTQRNSRLDLILAVSYGGREDIVQASQRLASRVKKGELQPEEIDVEEFASSLWTADIPDPDLLIRTSGELRISNFLLWQLAYAEIIVTPEYWPEFNGEVLRRCLEEYATRERRFGLTSEQIQEEGASEFRQKRKLLAS